MSECVFCRIVRGEAPASLVREDRTTVAFMDIQPVHRGHVLVVPKRHAALVRELDESEYADLLAAARKICAALQRSGLRGEGVTWFIADGPPDQEVPHVHVHLIPRTTGDGFGFTFPEGYRNLPPREELDTAAREIRASLESGS